MDYFSDITSRIASLRTLVGEVACASELPGSIEALDDASTVELMSLSGELAAFADQLCAVGAAVIARRSERSAGVTGVAQSRGHRNAVSFVQELTGTTRAEAAKHVRVGESLLEHEPTSAVPQAESDEPPGSQQTTTDLPRPPWHACLSRAVFTGALTSAQHDAIRRGLGAPPERDDNADATAAAHAAWALAAEQLISEAAARTVEELVRTARTVRDQLDPEGAHARFEARHLGRSFRTYTDADGIYHGHFTFEDEGFAWVRAIEAHFGVAIGFPIVEDPSMAVGRAYGMIDATSQDSAAVRATYIIDPDGIVRAINIYPHTVGRSVDEILRTVAALQQTADGKRLTPEGWQPGEAFLAPPSEQLMEGDDLGWFCRTIDAS